MNRAHISHRTKEAIIARQNDLCPMCGNILVGVIHFDHEIALACGGADDATNLRAVHADCHSIKTRDDVKRAAKCKRQAGETGQYARRLARKASGKRPLIQSNPKIPSRPFEKRVKEK